jgi:hypothetical protein
MANKLGELTIQMVNSDMKYIKSMIPDLKKAIRNGDATTANEITNEISGIGGNWATYVEEYENDRKGK